MRTKKSLLNLISEVLPQIVIAVLGFFRVKIYLQTLGTDEVGAYQLFGQILAYLSLAELGLGDAAMFYLYKPLHDHNHKEIAAIVSGIKKSFYYVMLVMLILGIALTPNVHYFINDSSLSNYFIMVAFFLTLLVNVLSYFSTPYVTLFNANQERYKYTFYTQGLMILKQVCDIVVAYVTKNLFAILVCEIIFTLLQDILVYYLYKKHFANINDHVKPDMAFWKKTKAIIPQKIVTLINNNIDVVLVSSYINLSTVVIYNAYNTITANLNSMLSKIYNASLASVGDLLVSKDAKAYNLFLEYNHIVFFIATIICVPLAIFITPFISLFYGAYLTVDTITMLLFVFILFYNVISIPLGVFTNAAALYKETLSCSIVEAVLNFTLSIILVQTIGIKGLLIGTIVGRLVGDFIMKPSIINKYIFKEHILKYYGDAFLLFLIAVLLYFGESYLIQYLAISNLLLWAIYGVLCLLITTLITIGLYHVLHKDDFMERFKRILKKEA